MTTIAITRDETGKLRGAGEKHQRAYARFLQQLHELESGELFTISYWFPRNPKLHGLHFAMLTAIYDAQEQFSDLNQFRKWVEVGAGHCDFAPGPDGRMVALPKSIAWDELDDSDFQEHHEKAVEFLRSTRCTRFLWPSLGDQEAGEAMNALLADFERE